MRVLVGEDDVDVRDLLTASLSRDGHEVRSCPSGAEVLAACAADPPDAVLLDVTLVGELTGVETLQRLRAVDAETPVVLVSALGSPAARAAGMAAGADDYVVKPFDLPDLLARVRALTRRSPRPGTGAPGPSSPDEGAGGLSGTP